MAAKRVDPLKAKEAKQKKIAIGGVVVLLALLGIQGPKTLKMLQGPQPIDDPVAAGTSTTSAAAAPAVPAPAGTETAGGSAAGEAPAAAAADLASVADSDPAPAAEAGQLATFDRFASKDPFAQQAGPVAAPGGSAKPAASGGADTAPAAKGAGALGGSTPAAGGGFTTGGSAPAPAEAAAATSIAVNGVAEDVKLEQAFPASEPTFVLVSLATDGKSVEIGIAGGVYADGGETLKLKFGKRITLQNTVDGSSYELELLAIEGFPPPKQK